MVVFETRFGAVTSSDSIHTIERLTPSYVMRHPQVTTLQEYIGHLWGSCLNDPHVVPAMIIAEFTLEHPILRETLTRCPSTRLTWEDSYITPAGEMVVSCWFETEDFDALEESLVDDPTIERAVHLTTIANRRLYRVTVVGKGRETSIMPLLVERGAKPLEITATHDGWRNRVRFPDRETFEAVYQFCRDRSVGFEFHRLYEQSTLAERGTPGLTDEQREVLDAADELGYLSIPRECSLAELAAELGISASAASERFRRAVQTLIEQSEFEEAPDRELT